MNKQDVKSENSNRKKETKKQILLIKRSIQPSTLKQDFCSKFNIVTNLCLIEEFEISS